MERTREKNDLGTPEHILDLMRAVNVIALDPCSNRWSVVNAVKDFDRDRGEDGLAEAWLPHCGTDGALGCAFVNNPYGPGQLLPWSRKLVSEAALGVEIVALEPTSPDTEWWRTLRDACDARCDFGSRIGFNGGAYNGGQIRSTFFYFGPYRYGFAHVFDFYGEVRVYDRRRPT